MDILKPAMAGTLESCDAAVTVEPAPAGAALPLEIVVEGDARYGARVKAAALSALAELGVTRARVSVRDRSALDCTVRARVMAACLRAGGAPVAGAPESAGPAGAPLPWEVKR